MCCFSRDGFWVVISGGGAGRMVCKCVVWVCFALHICVVSAAVYSVYEAEYDGDGQEGRGC